MLWIAYRLRVRHLQRRFETTLEARVGERTRIARELHDTLLQSFHGLMYRFQAVLMLLPGEPVKARQVLEGAVDQASQAITEGRDAVQGLRASATENERISPTRSARLRRKLRMARRPVCAFMSKARRASCIRSCATRSSASPTRRCATPPPTRKREAGRGRDPLRRARVPVARTRRRRGDRSLRSSRRAVARCHFGLRGMRERAQAVGGKLRLWSALDTGTEIELIIPGSRAYAASVSARSRLANPRSSPT